ncbi:MAG: GntR family transcriptional regulator [Blastocatellia bacterium]
MPPEQQVVTQLRLAIMIGVLQPGQKLPSVRDVESQTGVGRFIIWKAYSKLADSGLVTLENRRRAVVASHGKRENANRLLDVCDWLARDVLSRAQSLRINPRAFVRYLHHIVEEAQQPAQDVVFVECNSAQANRWSAEISSLWGLPVPGLEFKDIRALTPDERTKFRVVLTPLFHQEEVSELFQHPNTQVITLHETWNEEALQELRTLRKGRQVGLVLEEFECSAYGDALARELNHQCPNLKVKVIPLQRTEQAQELVEAGQFERLFLSGPVQERVNTNIKESKIVMTRLMDLDRGSLEEARIGRRRLMW